MDKNSRGMIIPWVIVRDILYRYAPEVIDNEVRLHASFNVNELITHLFVFTVLMILD